MIKNLLILIILIIINCCNIRKDIEHPVILSYKSKNIEANFTITQQRAFKKQSWEEEGYKYFYYGAMKAKLTSLKNTRSLKFIYANKESEVYLDTIASTSNFWDKTWWDSNGFREDKIYIVFDESNVDWNLVKIIELEARKSASKEDICKILSGKSYENYHKFCIKN